MIAGIVAAARASAGGVVVTWNPADKQAAMGLSGGNLVGIHDTSGSFWSPVRATLSRNSGKRQYRVRFDAGASNSLEVGLAEASFPISSGSLDSSGASWAMYSGTGDTYRAGTPVGSPLGAVGLTHWMDVAVDFGAGKIWFGLDGTFAGNPAAGTGERFTFTAGTALFPAAQLYNPSSQMTGAFSAAGIGTLISGFSPWE